MTTALPALRDRVEEILADVTNAKWTTDALDEAIRQALDLYSQYLPRRTLTTVTLSGAGREIDLAALDYLTVEAVWWDYDAADPAHPPRWRAFELWPGDILWINDAEQPQAGDVVRLWLTQAHTLDGLDSGTETTFPDAHASLIALGAAAFAAQTRRVDIIEAVNLNQWAPRNLLEWADARLADYRAALERLARQDAEGHRAGWAALGRLDRWDQGRG